MTTPIEYTNDIKDLLRLLLDKDIAKLRARNIEPLQDCPCSIYDHSTYKVIASFASRAELWAWLSTTYSPTVIAEMEAEIIKKKRDKAKKKAQEDRDRAERREKEVAEAKKKAQEDQAREVASSANPPLDSPEEVQ